MTEVEKLIENVSKKRNLTFEQSKKVFLSIMEGKVNEDLIYNFLVKLAEKGETAEEIAGGVNTLRDKAIKVETTNDVIDTCGTGGDGKNTLNISTASSLLLASMGVKVAKHGNKALSSKCGSADVLERLKININLKSDGVAESIQKNNFGFMFAPNYHFAMKYVAPIRKKIGKRTIFNLLGPLSSPADVKRQVVVFDKKWLLPFANALKSLSSTHAWIVHSEDGMDEISPFAPTDVAELKNNQINTFKINPKDLDIKFDKPENLIGQDSNFNANKIIDVFSGEKNEFSEAICLNVSAALIISGRFVNFKEAYIFAKKYLETDKVILHLKKIQTF